MKRPVRNPSSVELARLCMPLDANKSVSHELNAPILVDVAEPRVLVTDGKAILTLRWNHEAAAGWTRSRSEVPSDLLAMLDDYADATEPATDAPRFTLGELVEWAGEYVGRQRCANGCRVDQHGARLYRAPSAALETCHNCVDGTVAPPYRACAIEGVELFTMYKRKRTDFSINRNLLAKFLAVVPSSWFERVVAVEATPDHLTARFVADGLVLLVMALRDAPADGAILRRKP